MDIEQEYRRRRGTRSAYWFSEATMRFFATEMGGKTYRQKGNSRLIFVTSEQNKTRYHVYGPRRYSVRIMDHLGNIRTVGPFCLFTEKAAHEVAQDLADRKPFPGWEMNGAKIHD